MDPFTLTGTFLGGLGLFLLGMWMMTEGMKAAAGGALRNILGQWTKTPLRGLGSGALITALVQSSSAVIVATIGFVNAGLLSLTQSIWVILGANLGTTMTSWLVALIGVQIQIGVFALPLMGVGMLMRIFGGEKRWAAIGQALAGFGAFFLGIDVLRGGFADIKDVIDIAEFMAAGWLALPAFFLAGIVMTFITQSSSASMMIALTAAAGGAITLEPAAAMVVGANVGTTLTAVLVVIGATPNAQRVAAGHVIFNVITAVVALGVLVWLLELAKLIQVFSGLPGGPATTLALFHTMVKAMGIAILAPFVPRLVKVLSRRFITPVEDESRPRHLDRTLRNVPAVALSAARLELQRAGRMALAAMSAAMGEPSQIPMTPRQKRQAVEKLIEAISDFANDVNRAHLSEEVSEAMPDLLRASQHYGEIADFAVAQADAPPVVLPPTLAELAGEITGFRRLATALFHAVDTSAEGFDLAGAEDAYARLENTYFALKTATLRAASAGALSVGQLNAQMEELERIRRAAERALKAARRLARVPHGETP